MQTILFYLGVSLLVSANVDGELLRNGDFASGLQEWHTWTSHTGPVVATPEEADDRDTLHFACDPHPLPAWGGPVTNIHQSASVTAGQVVQAEFVVKAADASNGWGAYGAAVFLDKDGKDIAVARTGFLADGVWQSGTLRAEAPDGACEVRVSVELQGSGKVWVDRVGLRIIRATRPGPPPPEVTVRYEAAPVSAPFLGFGFEDDGFMYDEVQRSHGVTEEDLALRERRIRWLDPDFVRMQCWYGGWWPEAPTKPDTFDFDTDYMRSLCRTLSLYQDLGTAVYITGVTWGLPIYDAPAESARAIGALFEELIRERGFTCIRYWTVDNEPDITVLNRAGRSFENLVEMHRLVSEEFARRGLDIQIIGSDDANKMGLFERCVQTPAYDATVDVYSSHIYPQPHERVAIPFLIEERTRLLEGKRPLILAEFGFQKDAPDAFGNDYMDAYEYALYVADMGIQALNLGVSAMSIWTVQEMYYNTGSPPGRLMRYGLWTHKDRDWSVRPVYQAHGMFPRLTEPGDPVYAGVSNAPDWVRSVRVGQHAFLTNESSDPVTVTMANAALEHVEVYTAATSFGDGDCGEPVAVLEGRFTLPARGFAWGRITSDVPVD